MLPWLQGYSAAEDNGVLTYGPCVVFVLVKACVLLLVNQVCLNLTVKIYYTPQQCVCLHTATRRVLIHADCRWPSPTNSTTLPLYEMITCFIQTKLPLGQDFQRNATVFKWGQCKNLLAQSWFIADPKQ